MVRFDFAPWYSRSMKQLNPRKPIPVAPRFWAKVDKNGPLPDKEELGNCWIWLGGRRASKVGEYGCFWLDGRTTSSHRWSWESENGPIPNGLQIDHLCCTKLCVRPSHLEPVTPSENQIRSKFSGYCTRGHELNESNTMYYKNNSGNLRPRCKTCWNMTQRLRRAKNKGGLSSVVLQDFH